MKQDFENLERQRLVLQATLDAEKTSGERNRMGQFATPPALAQEILRYAATQLPEEQPIRFLDPAIGTGAFYSALRSICQNCHVTEATGFEVDPHYGLPAQELWGQTGLSLKLADFTAQPPDPRFNLLICNPPYVRHQHLRVDEKLRLQTRTLQTSGIRLSGLAGLYCHFIGISHTWMADGAIAGWLIPSEFMDVNYGSALKKYLLEKVRLLHIHRFDPKETQFNDALVSSAIVWLKNSPLPSDHVVKFSFGGTLLKPNIVRAISTTVLAAEAKWSRFPVADIRIKSSEATLSDFFKVKRGLATGDNSFFILPEEKIKEYDLPQRAFRPILPGSRYFTENEIKSDANGNPMLDRRLFLLDPRMNEDEIKHKWPNLWRYLLEGKARGVDQAYLCRHRSNWYDQEDRPAPPIICTYFGRKDSKSGRPFRFILNHSQATVTNGYLAMYPTPLLAEAMRLDHKLIRKVWSILNKIEPGQLLDEGRVYGGGLHKLEPKELANLPVPEIVELLSNSALLEAA